MSSDFVNLKVDKSIIKPLIPYLFKQHEYSGELSFPLSKKHLTISDEIPTYIPSKITKFRKGGDSSVSVAKGTINFHTHPKHCYAGEETNWGWPSGDDMRECIRFMFDGTICHIVFSLEGIYTIQVNPNMLLILKKQMKDYGKTTKDQDYARGIIISLIETYFKATHGHRCWKENEKLERKFDRICSPFEWVDFANKFTLDKLKASGKNQCSKELNCRGVPMENGKALDLQKYLQLFEYEHWNYDTNGQSTSEAPDEDHVEYIKDNFDSFIKLFNTKSIKSYGMEEWLPGQWFHCKFYSNCYKWDVSDGFKGFSTWFNWIKDKKKCKTKHRKGRSVSQKIYNFYQELEPDRLTFNDVPVICTRIPKKY